jgi:hypothetical protein
VKSGTHIVQKGTNKAACAGRFTETISRKLFRGGGVSGRAFFALLTTLVMGLRFLAFGGGSGIGFAGVIAGCWCGCRCLCKAQGAAKDQRACEYKKLLHSFSFKGKFKVLLIQTHGWENSFALL